MKDTGALLRAQEERVAAVNTPDDFQALITDRGIDIDGLTRVIGQRCTNLYAALSGQVKGWGKRTPVVVPALAIQRMFEQWIDGFALGVLMEHGEGEPVTPVLGFEEIATAIRDADSLSEEHGITMQHMGYDLMVLADRLASRVPPPTRPILKRAGVPRYAPGLDGLSMAVCVIRWRRDGHVYRVGSDHA
ncbi:hypothetical protein [Candidatus Solirubrobacter pratensis]|uniref:hypothetical protein n=1 Tax=Candidatus Solirubrobacter pratensis TaxID=1298857 RepID=UPI0004211D41|nr:hypothetical protein [Candidatus Solirubrobacter pratensis]